MPIGTISTRIYGTWLDAWIYKDTLLCWKPDGSMEYAPLDDVRKSRIDSDPSRDALAELLIFRNDWKHSSQLASLFGVSGVAAAVHSQFEPCPRLVIETAPIEFRTSATEPVDGYVLDTEVYGNRVLAASDQGLFETEFNPNFPHTETPLLQISDKPTYSVAARSGKLAASQREAGLATRDITFGAGSQWWREAESTAPSLTDDESISVSFASHNLVNYTSDSARFLRAETRQESPTGRQRYRQTVVSRFHRPLALEAGVSRAIRAHGYVDIEPGPAIDSADVRILGNSNYRLLVEADGDCVVVDVSTFSRKPTRLRADSRFDVSGEASLSTRSALTVQSLKSGFLIEQFESVAVMTEMGVHTLIDEPRSRVRSFPRSLRHNDCFVAVDESFIELVGFLEY